MYPSILMISHFLGSQQPLVTPCSPWCNIHNLILWGEPCFRLTHRSKWYPLWFSPSWSLPFLQSRAVPSPPPCGTYSLQVEVSLSLCNQDTTFHKTRKSQLGFFSSSSSTSICSSVVTFDIIYSTCIILSLFIMSYMKLTPPLHSIQLILEISCTNHCWTSPVLFLPHVGGKAMELQLVFHQRDWYPWHSRIHELSPQADLSIVFNSHTMSNWVGTARPPVGHSNWTDVEATLPLPRIQRI